MSIGSVIVQHIQTPPAAASGNSNAWHRSKTLNLIGRKQALWLSGTQYIPAFRSTANNLLQNTFTAEV
jgi:hypothetical protein